MTYQLVLFSTPQEKFRAKLPKNWSSTDKKRASDIAFSFGHNVYAIAHTLYVQGMTNDSDIETVLNARFGGKFAVSCYFGTIIKL